MYEKSCPCVMKLWWYVSKWKPG